MMANQRKTDERRTRGAVERLYAYWLASTVLLLLVAVALAIYTRAALQRAQDLAARVDTLEQQMTVLSTPAPVNPAIRMPPEGTKPPAARPLEPSVSPPVEPGPATPAHQEESAANSMPTPVEPVPTGPTDADVQTEAEGQIIESPATVFAVRDPAAAASLVQQTWETLGHSSWSGQTWADLAVLARLIERDAAALAFARRASEAGGTLTPYVEVSARAFLARGRPTDALPFAQRLVAETGAAPTAVVLLADALHATGETGAAFEVLQELKTIDSLQVCDLLRLARLDMALERWADLANTVGRVSTPPEALAAEYNFLYAVMQVQADRTVEALAILDALAADPEPGPREDLPWPPAHPDRYEILVWRGVALMYANQLEAARKALDEAARLDPGRPEAYYRRGILEAWDGKSEVAAGYLKNALASSARMAPAWEALASLELDADKVDPALEHLGQAIEIDPYRASAYYLSAIAHAKLSQAEQAADDLRKAFQLDPSYLEEAKQIEVFQRLFAPGVLERLAKPEEERPAE